MIEQCRQVLMRYAFYQDNGPSELFANLFAEDAVWDRSDGSALMGRAQILNHHQLVVTKRQVWVRHHITTLVLEPQSDNDVLASAYVIVSRGKSRDADHTLGYGFSTYDYQTKIKCIGNQFLIAHHKSQKLS